MALYKSNVKIKCENYLKFLQTRLFRPRTNPPTSCMIEPRTEETCSHKQLNSSYSMENSGVYSAEYQRGLRGELMDREVKMEQVQIGLITAEG